MQRNVMRLAALLAVGFLTAPVSDLHAQATQSTILGSVRDATGAVVPAAEVTIKNQGTNVERHMQTDEIGDYRIAGLEAGFYQVTVAIAGFNTFVQTDVDVNSAQIKRVNAVLEVGDIATTVTVEGGTSQVETETVTLSNIKTSRDYTQLPLSIFGRGWANITNVTAGVQSNSGFEVNGARDSANAFTSDGISTGSFVNSRNSPNGFSGEIEVLQEVKIMTSNNSAEYGQVAQFAAITKSGSNDLHGSLYWGNFNSEFSARRWQDRQPPSFINHNMFAITNGGPVRLPGVYDGRNKTFYFFSYGGARFRTGSRNQFSVPTPAFRNGDFSALADNSLADSDKIPLVDPLSGDPFANNTIPGSRMSGVTKAVQDLIYPDPNQTGRGAYGLIQNYTADPGFRFDSDVYSIRLDHTISNKNTVFARMGRTANNRDTSLGRLKNGFGSSNRQNIPGRSLVISDTHIFNPTLVNELKLGFSRDFRKSRDALFGQDVISQIGLQGIGNPTNDPAISGMPEFSFSGALGFAGTNGGSNDNSRAENEYQFIDNLSWYRGRHNIKLGFSISRMQINDQRKNRALRGSFNFNDEFSGLAYGDFLLGFPLRSVRTLARPNAYVRGWRQGFYIQDDFKVNSKMTFNIGMRYERQPPWVDRFDRLFTFDPNTGSLVTAGTSLPTDLIPAVAATLPIVTSSEAGLPTRGLMRTDNNNWNPRVGLAIRPFGDATTVFRLGYGLYTQMIPGLRGLDATGGPWQSTETFIAERGNPSINFPNPFQTSSNFSSFQSINASASSRLVNERTQQWNASVGRQIWGMALDVAYVGTKGSNLPVRDDLNLLRPSTIPFSSSRRPFPQFGLARFTHSAGSSIYHGLNIQADRRMSKGMYFNVNYTLAKALTDVSLRGASPVPQQNQYRRFLERADDTNIRRQQLRFSYIYELPFGRGKRFGGSLPTVANHIVGGWQISGITTLVTGQRRSAAFSGSDAANTNQRNGRPDRIGNGNFDADIMRDNIAAGRPIFDQAAFVRPEAGRGSFGNSARNILTGPGAATWNMVLAKNFLLKNERAKLQFRWEMFNAFNRPNFSFPNRNIQSGGFGLVTRAGRGRNMLFGLRLDY